MLDGGYVRRDPGAKPSFHATAQPSQSDLDDILTTVRVGLWRRLERRGLIRSETGGDEADPHAEEAPWLAACYAASVRGTVALGPKAGHYVGRLGGELAALPDSMPQPASCVRAEGYSLHAGVRVAAGDRPRLEQLCRYVARPALALDRLHELADGRFAHRLRHAWSDGTETLIFKPGTLIEKLVALVPRPNGHLTRFHGVLAPRASWRAAIVPRPAVCDEGAQSGAGQELIEKLCMLIAPPRFHLLRFHGVLAPRSRLHSEVVPLSSRRDSAHCGGRQRPGPSAPETLPPPCGGAGRLAWAALMKRVVAIDVLWCPRCGGRRRIVAGYPGGQRLGDLLARLGLSGPTAARASP